jgi:hypothetical protein
MMIKTTDEVACRQTWEKEESKGMGEDMQLHLCQKSTSRAENGRVSTYDVDVPWGPCCRTIPMGEARHERGKRG